MRQVEADYPGDVYYVATRPSLVRLQSKAKLIQKDIVGAKPECNTSYEGSDPIVCSTVQQCELCTAIWMKNTLG